MKLVLPILTIFLYLSTSIFAQTPRFIKPSSTDSNIDKIDNFHVVYAPNTTPINKLLVFLPGTGAPPVAYRMFMQAAANLGYHVVGVQYVNDQLVNAVCAGSTDSSCATKVRSEIIFGNDLHPGVEVNQANSLLNRASKLLTFLNNDFPTENWAQFLNNDTLIWAKTAFAGHSQGGGHAGIIGSYFSVDRAIQIASVDFISGINTLDTWQNPNGATSTNRYFEFTHQNDETATFVAQQSAWQALQVPGANNPLNIDSLSNFPADNNCFFSLATPNADPMAFHNASAADPNVPVDAMGNPLYLPIWNFMLGKNLSQPAIDCISNPMPTDGAVNFCTNDFLRWDAVSGILTYRVSLIKVVNGLDSTVFANTIVIDPDIFIPEGLDANSTYKWVVIPFNDNGSAQDCDTLSFTTTPFASPESVIGLSTDSVCVGDSIILTADVFGGNRPFTYQWSKDVIILDQALGNSRVAFTRDSAATYKIRLTTTDDFGCMDVSDDINLSFIEIPDTTSIIYTDTVLIAQANADSYQWYFNGQLLNGETGKTYTHNKIEGNYTVELFNQLACTSGMSEAYNLSTVGINSNYNNTLGIYPNPSHGIFKIDGKIAVETISVSNLNGQIIKVITINNNTFEIKAKQGIYIITVKTNDGKVLRSKLFLE